MTIAGASSDEIISHLDQRVKECDHSVISFVYVGGSVAKRLIHSESDIDIFVSIPGFADMVADDKISIQMEFLDLFDDRIAEKIDLTIFEKLRLDIQLEVFGTGTLIFERDEKERIEYMEKTMKMGYDFKIWLNSYLDQALK